MSIDKDNEWIFEKFKRCINLEVKKKIGFNIYLARVNAIDYSKIKQELTINYYLEKWCNGRLKYTANHNILLTTGYVIKFLKGKNKGYPISKDFIEDDLILLVKNLLNFRLRCNK